MAAVLTSGRSRRFHPCEWNHRSENKYNTLGCSHHILNVTIHFLFPWTGQDSLQTGFLGLIKIENSLKKTNQRLRPAHWADIGQPVLSKLHVRIGQKQKHTTALCGPRN